MHWDVEYSCVCCVAKFLICICCFKSSQALLSSATCVGILYSRTKCCVRKDPGAQFLSFFFVKGGITHTVSPNLMLILSTYRVVLHPSYLQKVFSFIIFIKERYSFTILSEKKPSSWRRAVGGAKEWRALAPIANKTETFDAVSLTVCSSESWPGSFIAETAPSFSIKWCANPAQPKTHFFRDILPERVPCSAAEWSALMGALSLSLVDACTGAFFREKCPYKEFHRRYVSKCHDWKKLSETCTNPEGRFLPQKYSVILPNRFLKTLAMLSMRIQLFNSV